MSRPFNAWLPTRPTSRPQVGNRESLTVSVAISAHVPGRVEALQPYFAGQTPDTVLAYVLLRGLSAVEREKQVKVPLAAAPGFESDETPALGSDPDEIS